MVQPPDIRLEALADELYEASEDDDLKLAVLLRELPTEKALRLCTSDLTNALQAYLYAFDEEPKPDIYELLLLEPSSRLIMGIKIDTVELAEIVFGFDTKSELFFIAVWNGEKFLAAFSGPGAYDQAVRYAKDYCA